MKADEPAPRLTKFGMTAEYERCILERHIAVTEGDRAIAAAHFVHMLRVGAQVLAVLTRGEQPPLPAPVAVVTEPALPEPVVPAAPTLPGPDKLHGLRAQLGLT